MTITPALAPFFGATSSAARHALPPALCCALTLLVAAHCWADTISSELYEGDLSNATRTIAVGTAPDSPGAHVDPNVPASLFAGVVSISVVVPSGSFIGSGVLLDSTHVLTAGHVVDVVGNDGVADPALADVTVVFNNNNPLSNVAGANLRGVSQIAMHPDYHPNILGPLNDDLSILTLSSPAPVGVPSYALSNNPFDLVQVIDMVGYGTAGDGVAGYTIGPNFFVKRVGLNIASFYVTDDEGSGSKEIFLFDFDGPDDTTDTLDGIPTLGNEFESTLGGGDSGGPAFLWNDIDLDEVIQPSELEIFGIDTFTLNLVGFPAPKFGSWGGGVIVPTYVDWINGVTNVVPEPGTIALLIVGTCGIAGLIRSARRRPA